LKVSDTWGLLKIFPPVISFIRKPWNNKKISLQVELGKNMKVCQSKLILNHFFLSLTSHLPESQSSLQMSKMWILPWTELRPCCGFRCGLSPSVPVLEAWL
jgi:hypothetical protein